jgi:uncharacterized protein
MATAEIQLYVDSSALAKLYVPEIHSDEVDAYLRGKVGLLISELAVTEVLSAIGRRKREGDLSSAMANRIRDALLADAESGAFARLHLEPAVHRVAERLLLATTSVPLRTLDALHLALAFSGGATHLLTFDTSLREAALQAGLNAIDL